MTDLEFVSRCVKGEKEAWNEFVDKYSNLIYRYIYSILKSNGANLSNHDQVEDIFQDIFVLLSKDNFSKFKSFSAKNNCTLASWLRQVVINHTIDCLRSLTPQASSLDEEYDDCPSLMETIADTKTTVSLTVMADEKLDALTDCIGKLGIDDKYFLSLFIDRGLKLDELKTLFGVSRGTIDMRKSRIIDRLRDCFKLKGFELDL
ncbi:MAG: sigma-70 family RNA polymerase sigma factor [Candidatus Omnitrophica bacterium]|nr:sigma-70 family RNA polymerase sigma factor [Candidatus Omnitrophota bacterium]